MLMAHGSATHLTRVFTQNLGFPLSVSLFPRISLSLSVAMFAPSSVLWFFSLERLWVSIGVLVAQTVKNLPALWQTGFWSLGQVDPLEKEMATHSSTCSWKIPWTEELGRVQSMGYKESDMTMQLTFTFSWRREWQPTPVFLPGKSQKELDTKVTEHAHTHRKVYKS